MNTNRIDYPCLGDIIIALQIYLRPDENSNKEIDIDEVVYDVISYWDQAFEGDDDWYNEDEPDMKDSLRDQVLEFYGWT